MASLKLISPWIACLAVLLNMLAMPLSRAMQTPELQLLLWGGFCSGSSSNALPLGFGKLLDTLQPTPAKTVMHQGDCCCGNAGLAALPSNYSAISCPDTPLPPSTTLNCQHFTPEFADPA